MTEELAELLADFIRPLPFADRVVGLARAYDEDQVEEYDGKQVTRRLRTPYPVRFPDLIAACDRNERYLLPSDDTPSVFFFQDYGTTDYTLPKTNLHGKESTLRLLGWLNPKWFDLPADESLILDAIGRALGLNRPVMTGPYQALTITAAILPAEVELFNKYTYATQAVPLLYPPYRLLGLELKCRYRYQAACPVPTLPHILDTPASC